MLKRTPSITMSFAALLTILIITLIEDPSRPLSTAQTVLFYLVALLPSFGIALLFDPFSKQKKDEYLKVNFYEEKTQ